MALQRVMKQVRNVYMMFSRFNTCSVVLYHTIQYQGECSHIEGMLGLNAGQCEIT